MSKEEVRAAIGEPLRRSPGQQCAQNLGLGGECWSYDSLSAFGGITLSVDIGAAGITEVLAYESFLVEGSESVFSLTKEKTEEGPRFTKRFQCPSM